MAKTQAAMARATQGSEQPNAIPDLSAKARKAVDAIKKPFTQFVKDFSALAMRREELAPQFMKAFGLWQAETGGTFVEFVRFLVPEVPAQRAEYRNHRAYQSADYLRRLQGNATRTTQNQRDRATAPAPPTDALARILATLQNMIPESQKARLWEAVETELHWTPRQVQRIQTQVEHVDPLVEVRGRNLDTLQLRLPEHTAEEATEAA